MKKETCSVKVGNTSMNALSLCETSKKIVVAGRSLLKVYEYDDNQRKFTEYLNLQVGRREQGLNMSSADVAWSKFDSNLIATGATNGAVVAWDLNTISRNKQLSIFNEHLRSVTKISFHPAEGSMLLSGSQDCSIKLFDIRKKQCSHTFNGRADGIRSVQFSPYNYFQFASSMDNGYVQIWDYRRPSNYLFSFIAHKGSVYTLDWHPSSEEKNTLVTGGRDKTVKIWNMSDSDCVKKCEIFTTGSVSTVKWRPRYREQLVTAYMMMDYNINLWDLRRCYVPYAQFQEHMDITTGIVWSNTNPKSLFSCSKDGTLMMHSLDEAKYSADEIKAGGLANNDHGWVMVAGNLDQDTHSPPASPHSTDERREVGGTQMSRGFSNILNRINSARLSDDEHTLSTSSPSNLSTHLGHMMLSHERRGDYKLEEFLKCPSNIFAHNAKEVKKIRASEHLDDYRSLKDVLNEELTMSGFEYAAQNYILDGFQRQLPFTEACQLNSKVALTAGQPVSARTWLLVSQMYENNVLMTESPSKPDSVQGGGVLSRTHSDAAHIERAKKGGSEKESKRSSLIVNKDEVLTSSAHYAGDYDSDLSAENRNGFELYFSDIARGRSAESDAYNFGNDSSTSRFNDSIHLRDVIHTATDFSDNDVESLRVPVEAFEFKEDISMDAISSFGHVVAPFSAEDVREAVADSEGGKELVGSKKSLKQFSISSSEEEYDSSNSKVDLMLTCIEIPPKEDAILKLRDEVIQQQLKWLAENGFVQTAVCILILLQTYPIHPIDLISERTHEYWQNVYISLLFRRRLFVQRAEVIKISKLASVQALASSSTIPMKCGYFRSRLKNGTFAVGKTRKGTNDRHRYPLCSICVLPIRRLLLFCQTCALSAHENCAKRWFKHLESLEMHPGCQNHSF